jgi:hypothetical protein
MSALQGESRRMPAARAHTGAALSLPYKPAWVAVAHPDQWAIVKDQNDGWHILPRLLTVALVPGVGGVREARDSNRRRVADAREVIAIKTTQGYVEVPQVAVHAGGQDQPDYCVRYQTAQGGTHLWAWELPEVTRGQQSIVKVDRAAHVAFLRWVQAEVLKMAGPPAEVVAAIRADLRSQAARLIVQARTNASRATVLEHVAGQVRALGFDDGLDLPAALKRTHPAAQPPAPRQPPADTTDDLRAQIAALQAQLAATAAPPAAPAMVGSASPEVVALDDDALDDAPPRAATRIPRRPTGAA